MDDGRTLVARVLKVDEAQLADDDGVDTLAQWDSLAMLLLASMIEVTHGVTLSNADIEDLTSVRNVRGVMGRHGIA